MPKQLFIIALTLGLGLSACQAPLSTTDTEVSVTTTSAQSAASFLTLNVGKAPHGIGANADFVYNANAGENTLSVIDTHQDQVVKTLPLSTDQTPGYIKASHDGKYMLVLSSDKSGAGQLHIFEPANDHRLVQSLSVGQSPDILQLSENDRDLYISLAGEAGVAHFVFDKGLGSAPAPRQLIEAGSGSREPQGHRALAMSSGWLLTPNPGNNSVSLISPTGEQRVLRDGNNPGPVALASIDGQISEALVGNSASHTLSLFNVKSGEATTLSDLGQSPTDIALVPELGRAYVSMAGSNQVAVVDYLTRQTLGTVKTQQRPVHLYVAPPKEEADKTIEMQIQHEGHDHDKITEIWVSNDASASVTVFNAQTLEVIDNHPVGEGHHKIAFSQNKVYISNLNDNTLTVIPR